MLKKQILFSFLKFILVLVFAIGLVAGIVKAGTLTPSATPTSTSYTLTDIYTRLTTNAAATEADHVFSPGASPAATLYTLKQIYEAIPGIVNDTVKLGTSYLGVAGSLTPVMTDGTATTTAALADVFSAKTAHLTGDWTLDTGILVLACATSSFDGADNLVATAYDGAGNGTNRWCMKDTGDAAAGEILADKIAWVDGLPVTGSMTNVGQQAITPSTANQTITAGYHDGTGYCVGDAALLTGNIKTGITLFGVAGDSNVVDTSSGDASTTEIASGKIAWVDGEALTGTFGAAQWLQTKDDWVNSGGTSSEYIDEEAHWADVSGSPFSGYDEINYLGAGEDAEPSELDLISGIVIQDERTGLWWSDIAAEAGSASTTQNSFTLTGDGARPTGGRAIGFCDALNTANFGGNNDWYLPTQKQLQQAYIDGSANNLPNPGYYFWSATERTSSAANAWRVHLNYGHTYNNTKVTSNNIRCVRP